MNKTKITLVKLLDKQKGNLSIREYLCISLIKKALNGSLDAFKLIKELLSNETIISASNMEISEETIEKVMDKLRKL